MSEDSLPEPQKKQSPTRATVAEAPAPAPAPAPPAPKAKVGDVVMFWAEPQGLFRHAVVVAIDASNVASLKVAMPPARKGVSGGIKRLDGVSFGERPKTAPEKPATGWCLEQQ